MLLGALNLLPIFLVIFVAVIILIRIFQFLWAVKVIFILGLPTIA